MFAVVKILQKDDERVNPGLRLSKQAISPIQPPPAPRYHRKRATKAPATDWPERRASRGLRRKSHVARESPETAKVRVIGWMLQFCLAFTFYWLVFPQPSLSRAAGQQVPLRRDSVFVKRWPSGSRDDIGWEDKERKRQQRKGNRERWQPAQSSTTRVC